MAHNDYVVYYLYSIIHRGGGRFDAERWPLVKCAAGAAPRSVKWLDAEPETMQGKLKMNFDISVQVDILPHEMVWCQISLFT